MGKLVAESFERGVLKDTSGLRSSVDGLFTRSRDPFPETKEVISPKCGCWTTTELGPVRVAYRLSGPVMPWIHSTYRDTRV
jgi:hypothetical protein